MSSEYENYLQQAGPAYKGYGSRGCCGCGPGVTAGDPVAMQMRQNWIRNALLVAIAGLLIWNALASSAMGYGMISTQPQLEETTGYTRAMKVSTESAINGTRDFLQARLAEFPKDQTSIWLHQMSDTLASVKNIMASMEHSVAGVTSPEGMAKLTETAVATFVDHTVTAEDKAQLGVILGDVTKITSKLGAAFEQMSPDELAQFLRTASQVAADVDSVVSVLKAAFQPKATTAPPAAKK